MQVSIILPTLNERENLVLLLNRVKNILKKSAYEIIVVDDNSVDGTWQYVMSCAKKDKRIRLIRRLDKKGLSSAIFDGVNTAKGELIVVMDADLQHDESIIPEMLSKLKTNELVVGVRRMILEEKTLKDNFRLFRSGVAAFMARLALGDKLKDPLSGFFAFRKPLFARVKKDLRPIGFKFLIDFYVKSNPKKISEVEYVFGKRNYGRSKLSSKVMMCFFTQICNLVFFKLKKRIKKH